MSIRTTLAAAAVFTLSPMVALASTWTIDASHSDVGFSVRHLMVSNVKGSFPKVTGTIQVDDKDLTKTKIDVEIDAASIDTRDDKRDEHLRGEDFFWVQKHPKITFKSNKVTRAGKGYKVNGDLTIRGVTKPVVLDVESLSEPITDPWGNVKRGVVAKTKINRKDFGVSWNNKLDGGGVVVGDTVEILIEAELAQQKPAQKK